MSKASIQRIRDIANYLLEDVLEFGMIETNDEVYFLGHNDESLLTTPDEEVLKTFVKAFNERVDELESKLRHLDNVVVAYVEGEAEQDKGVQDDR